MERYIFTHPQDAKKKAGVKRVDTKDKMDGIEQAGVGNKRGGGAENIQNQEGNNWETWIK